MKGLSVFGAIAVFIAMVVVWGIVEHLLKRNPLDGKSSKKIRLFAYTGLRGWIKAFCLGAISGLTMIVSGLIRNAALWWIALALFVLMAAIDFYLGYRFRGKNEEQRGASDAAEVFWFAVMALLVYLAMRTAAAAFFSLVHGGFWGAIIMALPFFIMLGLILFFIGDAFYARHSVEENKKDRQIMKVLYYAFFVLALLALILGILVPVCKNWDKRPHLSTKTTVSEPTPTPVLTIVSPTPTPTPTSTSTPTPEPTPAASTADSSQDDDDFVLRSDDWYELRHLLVVGGEKSDDDDFGPNPLDEILAAKVASGILTVKDISGKTEKELYSMVEFDELFGKFVGELEKDPIKGAAVMGYYDVIRGTNFLGKFSTELLEHKDALMELINEKAVEWLQDQDEYLRVLTAFVATLLRSDEMEISYAKSGLDDQMYMFGTTYDHVPIVIVMESTDHSGWLLSFRDYIKGTTKVEVNYRIDCDFQPTNVGKVAPVTVNPNPNKPAPTGGGTPPSTGGGTPPTTGGGTPPDDDPYYPYYPPVTNPKDPTKGTPVGGNSGNGPGPSTNNGVGATTSSAEKPTNSLTENLSEYWEDVEDLQEPTKVSGDSNSPSYIPFPPPDSLPPQDNNGGRGNGYGGADQKTSVAPEVSYKDPNTGQNKTFDNESAGQEWEIGT